MENFEKFARIKRDLHDLEAALSLGNLVNLSSDAIANFKANILESLDAIAETFDYDRDELLSNFPRITKILDI